MARQTSFIVLALTRDDVAFSLGRQCTALDHLSDWQMEQIADKVNDALYELDLWDIVAQVAEEVLD